MSVVSPINATSIAPLLQSLTQLQSAPQAGSSNFASLLAEGVKAMEAKVARADQLVQSFALGDNVPVHQVTFALEEARLSVELAMQVRTRILEGYRELMNMQL